MFIFLTLFISLLILLTLTTYFKISPFLALLLVAISMGISLGMPLPTIVKAMQKGIGDLLGNILITLVAGAMIGKLVAESGAASVIAQRMMQFFGQKYLQCGLVFTGLAVGIPLFYNVGFVVVLPLIFSLLRQYRLPLAYVVLPILASLSVAHSLLPPHPSPASLVGTFHADMARTFFYGLMIALPAIILAGIIFPKFLIFKKAIALNFELNLEEKNETTPKAQRLENTPSFLLSLSSALLPVFLLTFFAFLAMFFAEKNTFLTDFLIFINEPTILMLVALAMVSYTLGIKQGKSIVALMSVYEESIKEIASILLIIGASGALKQILIESNMSGFIATYFQTSNLSPLVLGWVVAAVIRVMLGSATVAGLTAAGLLAPMMTTMTTDANLMVLSIGAGSIFFSHVNDTGFWMFKEYFKVSLKTTFLTWTIMESIVSIAGLLGVLILEQFL